MVCASFPSLAADPVREVCDALVTEEGTEAQRQELPSPGSHRDYAWTLAHDP